MESAGAQIYFASGIFDQRLGRVAPSDAVVVRLYHEASALIEELCDVGHPRVAHELVELLDHLAHVDPALALTRISRVISATQHVGYLRDRQVMELLVKIVRRFITEFRGDLLANPQLQALLVLVLDSLVEGGWPEAISLANEMHHAFR